MCILKLKGLFIYLFIVGFLFLLTFSAPRIFAHCGVVDGCWKRTRYGSCTNMNCSWIIKKWDATWFHYATETCPLKVKDVHDVDYQWDEDCGDYGCWIGHGNYMNTITYTWTGEGVSGVDGTYCVWDRRGYGPTGEDGVTVTFEADDYTICPNPVCPCYTINDEGPLKREINMHAYEAVAYLNVTSHSGTQTTGDIHEWGGSPGEILKNFSYPVRRADDDGETVSFNSWAKARWVLSVCPTQADLASTGQLKSTIGVDASGELVTTVYDNDLDIESVAVTVALIGGPGWGASVTITIPYDDDFEGSAGLGFAFSSDDLEDSDSTKLEVSSSDYENSQLPKTEKVTYSHADSQVFYTPTIGSDSRAKAVAKGEGHCEENGSGSSAYAEIACQAGTGDGVVAYSVDVPSYEPGSGFVLNPDW